MARLFYKDVSGTTGTVELQTAPVLIGRATDCQIQTQDAQVSRRHARVIFDGSSYWIEDTGSANGVFVGNERVPRYQLRPGTSFRCGYLEVRFELDAPAGGLPVAGPPAPPAAPVAPVAPAAVPVAPVVAAPSAAPSVGVSELQSLRSELESERRKRTDLEFELSEQRRKLDELQAKPAQAVSEADADRLRRRVEQLESELKRKAPAGSGGGASSEALRATEAERDRLRTRVAELEAKAKEPSKNDDQEMELIRQRRRVEQLEADLRRVRGGKPAEPAPAPSGDALVAELEEKVRRLIEERDEAVRKASTPVLVAPAAAAPTDPKVAEELERAKRRIEQLKLQSEELSRLAEAATKAGQSAANRKTRLPNSDAHIAFMTALQNFENRQAQLRRELREMQADNR